MTSQETGAPSAAVTLFDTHAHYYDAAFDADRDALLSRLPSDGVRYVVNVGCNLARARAGRWSLRSGMIIFTPGWESIPATPGNGRTGRSTSCVRWRRTRRSWRSGKSASTTTTTPRRATYSARRSARRCVWPKNSVCPCPSTTATRTAARALRSYGSSGGARRVPLLFRLRRDGAGTDVARLVSRLHRRRDVSKREKDRGGRRGRAGGPHPARDGLPVPGAGTPAAARARDSSLLVHTGAKIADLRGVPAAELYALTCENARRFYGV